LFTISGSLSYVKWIILSSFKPFNALMRFCVRAFFCKSHFCNSIQESSRHVWLNLWIWFFEIKLSQLRVVIVLRIFWEKRARGRCASSINYGAEKWTFCYSSKTRSMIGSYQISLGPGRYPIINRKLFTHPKYKIRMCPDGALCILRI